MSSSNLVFTCLTLSLDRFRAMAIESKVVFVVFLKKAFRS